MGNAMNLYNEYIKIRKIPNKWTLVMLKLNKSKKGGVEETEKSLKHITRSHGKWHGGGEERLMNPKLGQWWASPDARRKNVIV